MRYCKVSSRKPASEDAGLIQNGVVYDIGDLTWYAVRVPPMKGFLAERILREKGYAVMCPVHRMYGRVNRRAKRKDFFETPLLPGYILVGFNGRPNWYRLLEIGRQREIVTGVVRFNGAEAPIPERSMAWVARMHKTATIKISDLEQHKAGHFEEGDKVEILEGAFSGFVAPVLASTQKSARVLVTLFGRENITNISVDNLKKVA